MRDIKFRAKSLLGNIEYGYFVKDYLGTAYITSIDGQNTSVVDENTLGQFTGLTDKNGKEIYEGDILISKVELKGGVSKVVEVFYGNAGFDYRYKDKEGKEESMYLKNYTFHSLEVIGNIHDNPELLKQ